MLLVAVVVGVVVFLFGQGDPPASTTPTDPVDTTGGPTVTTMAPIDTAAPVAPGETAAPTPAPTLGSTSAPALGSTPGPTLPPVTLSPAAIPAAPSQLDVVKARGKLLCGVPPSQDGFNFRNIFSGLNEGFEVDLVSQVKPRLQKRTDDE